MSFSSFVLNSFFNTKNDFNRLNKTQKAELKNAIGDELFSVLNKRKPNNIKDFILKRTEELNRKKFGLILCDTSTDSKITKSFSNIFINKKMIECYSEKIATAYKNIYTKLPKNRLKTAAKWFGMGICFSMLMNIIFGEIRNRKIQK